MNQKNIINKSDRLKAVFSIKKALYSFIALLLMFALLPTTAFADDGLDQQAKDGASSEGEVATEQTDQYIKELADDITSVTYGGHTYCIYDFTGSSNTWFDAKRFAETLGGYLAVINSQAENDFLFSYVINNGLENAYFGYSDYAEEGNWKWVDGSNSKYTNWHSGEPNAKYDDEDFAMFYWKFDDGTWNDGDFSKRTNDGKFFIVEWGDTREFKMGTHNYLFNNSAFSFGYPESYRIPLARFQAVLSPNEAQSFYEIYGVWGGSCFGFSTSSAMFYIEALALNSFTSSLKPIVRKTSEFIEPGIPPENQKLIELFETYQVSQFVDEIGALLGLHTNDIKGLINAINVQGAAILVLRNSMGGGHAVIAYDYNNKGNNEYEIFIYDNNYPTNNTLRLKANLNKMTWSYESYKSSKDYYISWIDPLEYKSLIENALNAHGGNASIVPQSADAALIASNASSEKRTKIVVPKGGSISSMDGKPIDSITEAYKIPRFDVTQTALENTIYSAPSDKIWRVKSAANAGSNQASFFDTDTTFQLQTNDSSAIIEGASGEDGYITVLSNKNNTVNAKYMTNETADDPLLIKGTTNGSLTVTSEDVGVNYDVTIAGDGKLTVANSHGSKDINLTNKKAARIDSQLNVTVVPTADIIMRHNGKDRCETAAKASKVAYPNGAASAIVAYGGNFPDAQAASYLAGVVNGPILLSGNTSLDLSTRTELLRLKPKTIYILGDKNALNSNVENAIKQLSFKPQVTRLGGASRYETAYLIAKKAQALSGKPIPAVFVCYAGNFPDALSVGSIAASKGVPILLTDTPSLNDWTKRFIADHKVQDVILIGSTKSISQNVANQINAIASVKNVERWFGDNRYTTAQDVVDKATARWNLKPTILGIASGEKFPDALVGGAVIGNRGGILVLTSPSKLSASVANAIVQHQTTLTRVELFGGTNTLPDNLLK